MLVNIFGSPGSGKSTLALYLTGYLKGLGINAEYAHEHVKTLIALGDTNFNEIDILASQYRLIGSFFKSSDVVVTDSPLLNSGIYCKEWDIQNHVWSLSKSLHARFRARLNILVYPCSDPSYYSTSLRYHSFKESLDLHENVFKDLLTYDLGVRVIGEGAVSLDKASSDIYSLILERKHD